MLSDKLKYNADQDRLPTDSLYNRQMFNESRFKPAAKSMAGALGLTQITEDTFDFLKSKGKVPEGKSFINLATDTNLSQKLGKDYMEMLMNRSWNTDEKSGNLQIKRAKALAAYNMGPTALVRHLNKQKESGVDIKNSLDWIGSLNPETKNYVNNILLGGSENYEEEYKREYDKKGKEYR